MGPPKKIRVGPHTYQVSLRADMAEMGMAGHCDTKTCVIKVDSQQCDSMVRDTVLHETLHAAFNAAGLEKVDDDLEEQIVRPVATVLLDVLRRNPELVKFLTDG